MEKEAVEEISEEGIEQKPPQEHSKGSSKTRESHSPQKKEEPKKDAKVSKEVVTGVVMGERVITENSDPARELYSQSRYGVLLENGKVQMSLLEALYLMEKGKLIIGTKKKKMGTEEFIKKAKKIVKEFWIRYCVFKDLRTRGYIVKTALKFGADFRVYDRGVKPGEDHARWIVYPVHESASLTWQEFAAKNRVAHSTRKRLLLGVVDEEGEVSYWESRWLRP